MAPSQACVDLVKQFESCRLLAYDDARPDYVLQPGDEILGTLTIGWGYTGPDVHIGLTWSQAQADAELLARINQACDQMAALVKVPLVQGQVDALTDFTYNLGSGTLEHSTLLILLNAAEYARVPNELVREDEDGNYHGFVFAGGVVDMGLVDRRKAEISLWNS